MFDPVVAWSYKAYATGITQDKKEHVDSFCRQLCLRTMKFFSLYVVVEMIKYESKTLYFSDHRRALSQWIAKCSIGDHHFVFKGNL
jgi:hypothetical protein